MIYIFAVIVLSIVALIVWSVEIEERDEELKGKLTKSDLRELMRGDFFQSKNTKK